MTGGEEAATAPGPDEQADTSRGGPGSPGSPGSPGGPGGPGGPPAAGPKPSAMRGREPLYGNLVALALVGVATLNLTVTHGAGAPAHPQTALSAAGLVASVALLAVVRTGNRLAVGLGALLAAYLVSVPRAPVAVSSYHLFAMVPAFVYAMVLTQRQRKEAAAQARAAGGRAPGGRAGRASSGGRGAPGATGSRGQRHVPAHRKADPRSGPGSRGRAGRRSKGTKGTKGTKGSEKASPAPHPAANRRYTPPAPKRAPRPRPTDPKGSSK